MLPSAHRMQHSGDFRVAVRSGTRGARPALVVHLALPTAGSSEPARVGFVVSRAVGPAVVRNTVRRRLRHLVRDRLDRLPRGALVVVRAQPAAAGAPGAVLGADLDAALDRALGRRTRGARR